MSEAAKYFSQRHGFRDYALAGPFATILDDFARELEDSGYAPATIQGYLRAARHVTWSIEHRQLRRTTLTPEGLRDFARNLHASCACPFPEKASANARSAMPRLLTALRKAGVAEPAKPNPILAELDAYCDYAREVGGIADDTLDSRRACLAPVLQVLMPHGRFDPRRLGLTAINKVVLQAVEAGHTHKARRIVDSMRGFLRYLAATGRGEPVDVSAICSPKQPPYSPSRKALTVQQLRMLLRPLREHSTLAARDFAVLLLMARTGLRRSDVARLELGDFQARAMVLVVRRNKSRLGHEVPLPRDVRDAILDYVCHYRRSGACSALFLAENHPYDAPLSPGGVTAIVSRAFARAGIEHPSRGAHVLRHTLATHLVASRAPLKAIADALVHKSIETTVRYARIDRGRLEAAVRPWSGASSDS